MDYTEFMKIVKARKSVRGFKAEPRPKRDIPIHSDRYDEDEFMSGDQIAEAIKNYCPVK